MYTAFYGLKEKPFSLLPDPGFLYPSRQHQMALSLLEYGLENQAGFTVITGEIGTGKTTLIRQLLNQVSADLTVGLISNSHQSFGELLHWILEAYGLEVAEPDSRVAMYRQFVDFVIGEYAKQRRTVLILDEAQNLSVETLEELRMLSNINTEKDQVLQVMLIGQQQLRDTLQRPDMVQFAQRISTDFHLSALNENETVEFIHHRLQHAGGNPSIFPEAACRRVFHHSAGVPRLINLLCDTTLVYGYAENLEEITASLVDEVALEKQRGGLFPTPASVAAPPETDTAPAPAVLASVPEPDPQPSHHEAGNADTPRTTDEPVKKNFA